MTTRYKVRAFVFGKDDMNEADRYFSVFTDGFGRLDVFGKAIRKTASKLRSGIDIFYISDIEFIQGKSKKILTEAQAVEKFGNICKDQERFETASKIANMIESFVKGTEKDENIFNLLRDSFLRLDDETLSSKKCQLIYYYFLWNALSFFGYCPEVHKCNICQKKLDPCDIYFSAKAEGIICNKCKGRDIHALEINSDVVKILRIILLKDWQTLSKLKIGPDLATLMSNISGRALNSFCPA